LTRHSATGDAVGELREGGPTGSGGSPIRLAALSPLVTADMDNPNVPSIRAISGLARRKQTASGKRIALIGHETVPDPSRATSRRLWNATLCLTVGVITACNKSEPATRTASASPQAAWTAPATSDVPFRVTRIDLGTAIDRDKKIIAPTIAFGRYDVIYASVLTEGSATDIVLKARWTFGDEGELVHESTQLISPSGPAATEFRIAKQDGWPAGKYKIEVTAKGQPAGAVEYRVSE
jgi:hypothetical protein